MSDCITLRDFCKNHNIRKIDFFSIAHGVYDAFTSVESDIFSSLAQQDFMSMVLTEDKAFLEVLKPFMHVAIKIIEEYETIGQLIKGDIND